jgi:hypothetical protein
MDRRLPGDTRRLCYQLHGNAGINSTPVIDQATNTMWVVFRTASPFDSHVYDAQYWIQKLDIRTGNVLAQKQIVPRDPAFDPNKVLTRTGLLLQDGIVYIGFAGAVCDDGGGDQTLKTSAHGWVVAINATDLSTVAALNTTPGSTLGGIWQSGYGLASDKNGFVYAFTGNNRALPTGIGIGSEMSEAALRLKLAPDSTAFQTQHYTLPNWNRLDDGDTDLGSGGPFILPNGFVAGGGKQGSINVFNPGDWSKPTQQFQAFFNSWHSGISPCDYDLDQTYGANIHGIPVSWTPAQSTSTLVYDMPEKDYLKSFEVDQTGKFDERPFASTLESGIRSARGMPGGFLSLSANGGLDGIIWASAVVENGVDAIITDGSIAGDLMAFDAITLRLLWKANEQASFAKMIPPTIASGKVFRSAYANQIIVYGITGFGIAPVEPRPPPTRQVTAALRDPHHIDLFMTSRDSIDGSILTTNWEPSCQPPALRRGWRGWFPVYSSMDASQDTQPLPSAFVFKAPAGQPIKALWRNRTHLDLFTISATNGSVMSNYWEPALNHASGWKQWFPIGATSAQAAPGQPITALWRNGNHLDLFMTDRSGRIISTYFDNNTWQTSWFPVSGSPVGHARPGQPVTALWRNSSHLDLFVTDSKGNVISTYFENGRWQPGWFPLPGTGPGQLATGQQVTAVWRNGTHLDLFAADATGRIISTYFDTNKWQPAWFVVPGTVAGQVASGQSVTAIWRNGNTHMDLFATDRAGRIISTYFDTDKWQSGWFVVASSPTGQANPGQPVTALWRDANHLDLFISDRDGRIKSTYFENNAWLNSWFSI